MSLLLLAVAAIDGRTNTLITSIATGGSIVDGVAYDSLNNNIYAVMLELVISK